VIDANYRLYHFLVARHFFSLFATKKVPPLPTNLLIFFLKKCFLKTDFSSLLFFKKKFIYFSDW
jgi:hypothetical protein